MRMTKKSAFLWKFTYKHTYTNTQIHSYAYIYILENSTHRKSAAKRLNKKKLETNLILPLQSSHLLGVCVRVCVLGSV